LTTTRGLATSANQTANQAANLERRLALNPDNDFGPVSQPRPLSGAATPPAPTNAIGAGAGTANGARVVELPAGGTGAAAQNTVGGAFTAQLEGGGAWLMSENKYRRFVEGKGLVGRADGQFMTSSREINRVLASAAGDVEKINKMLGTDFEPGERLIRIDVNNPLDYNPRLPDSSLSGANAHFVPGGMTSGGVPEIVTDPLPAGSVWATPVE